MSKETLEEKEFLPYEIALALKELNFEENCLGYFVNNKFRFGKFPSNSEFANNKNYKIGNLIAAPTFSQSFRFFRENHNLYTNIDYDWNDEVFRVEIMKHNEDKSCNIIYLKEGDYIKEYKTYEEAELECLRKLIKICKYEI